MLTFEQRAFIRQRRSDLLRGTFSADADIAELELAQAAGEELTARERALVMMANGASIRDAISETGLPKSMLSDLRQQYLGKQPSGNYQRHRQMEPDVVRLYGELGSITRTAKQLGVSRWFVTGVLKKHGAR